MHTAHPEKNPEKKQPQKKKRKKSSYKEDGPPSVYRSNRPPSPPTLHHHKVSPMHVFRGEQWCFVDEGAVVLSHSHCRENEVERECEVRWSGCDALGTMHTASQAPWRPEGMAFPPLHRQRMHLEEGRAAGRRWRDAFLLRVFRDAFMSAPCTKRMGRGSSPPMTHVLFRMVPLRAHFSRTMQIFIISLHPSFVDDDLYLTSTALPSLAPRIT